MDYKMVINRENFDKVLFGQTLLYPPPLILHGKSGMMQIWARIHRFERSGTSATRSFISYYKPGLFPVALNR